LRLNKGDDRFSVSYVFTCNDACVEITDNDTVQDDRKDLLESMKTTLRDHAKGMYEFRIQFFDMCLQVKVYLGESMVSHFATEGQPSADNHGTGACHKPNQRDGNNFLAQ
jgi:hypothetical protein